MNALGNLFLLAALVFWLCFQFESVLTTEADETFEHCLMELRMSELLRLQHSLQSIKPDLDLIEDKSETNKQQNNETLNNSENGSDGVQSCPTQNCLKPMAMALTGKSRGYHSSTVHHHHPWQPEEKPSKLQTFFLISITALAFLSFGGYLLCLIVHAIKSKGTTYLHPVATTATTNNGGVKRIKVYRRGRRAVSQRELNIDEDWLEGAINYGYVTWH